MTTNHTNKIRSLTALYSKSPLLSAYVDIAIDAEFSTEKQLLGWLNCQCDTKYGMNHWSDWKCGRRPIPGGIATQMRREILQYLFDDETAETLMTLLLLGR